jgi:hypothetical protein
MEECIICFDETNQTEFIIFDCKHKVCIKCYPILLDTTSKCPNCDIQLNKYPQVVRNECEICKYTNRCICFMIIMIIFIIIYNNNILHG